MKNVVSAFFDQLEKDVLERLCAEVKESVATGLVYPEKKVKSNSFGITDLWACEKTGEQQVVVGIKGNGNFLSAAD